MSSGNQDVASFGWTAVPRSQSKLIAELGDVQPARTSVNDIKLPESELAKKTYDYAKEKLPEKTFNHSLRVFYYGAAIAKAHFPQWSTFLETYYLTCLLHDIGTTDDNLSGTHMSFEYYGAFIALEFLKQVGAPKNQAESVSEAIVRHADLGEAGTLTSLGQLIQLSTVFGEW
ncbi:cyanamide hydratase [Lophiostoma macrostomum CBS 122681]|uniref:Cyanamide hydratase n=1 Tax=Lophiostoma macrostomum CBS 122681 TaxID=1314788 RepID=A0A6A6SV72_9PLEO|nr:cyanamide hydratase [Lophiostoma macrostomum CBS 122681]